MKYKNTFWLDKKIILGEGEIDSEKPIKILIGFHGADSTPENILVHGNKLNLSNTITVYPEGPIEANEGSWSWWLDGPGQKNSIVEFIDFTSQIIDEANNYVKKNHSPRNIRTCLWGFSQGAAASLVYTLMGKHSLFKVASICGFLPELPDDKEKNPENSTILGIFGTNDEIIPSFLADHALEEMKNQGHDLTIKETSQSHEINSDNIFDMTSFFNSG